VNAINHGVTKLFDLLLWPLEKLGNGPALVIASGIFGVIALIAFKHLSRQKAIKAAKDKVKAHLIEIRIYQDDLRIVGRAIGKVLARNAQYLGLNLLPFVPLAIPFTFVLAQLVVRYAYAPVPVTMPAPVAGPSFLAGQGTTIEVALEPGSAARVKQLSIQYPDGVSPVSPLVRVPSEGRAFQEIVAARPGRFDITLLLPGAGGPESATKVLYAGDVAGRSMQPERGRGLASAMLWPAEDTFGSGSSFARVAFRYPDSDMGWLPGGPGGVVIVFLVSSLVFGALAIKPLRIQI
jgi:hypothetical protein